MKKEKRGDRGQITLFVILGIIIVVLVLSTYFIFLKKRVVLPEEARNVEEFLKECINEKVRESIGEISIEGIEREFEAGSTLIPFSSHVSFLKTRMPYWYYVSASGIPKENVPTIEEIERELEKKIKEKGYECIIKLEERFPDTRAMPLDYVDVRIKDRKVITKLGLEISIPLEEKKITIKNHEIKTRTNFGLLYKDALKVYSEIKKGMLTNYTLDILRIYLPVDGVEFSCSPLIFEKSKLREELQKALININMIKIEDKKNGYFSYPLKINSKVNFLSLDIEKFEIEGHKEEIIIEPIGTKDGLLLSSFGFCVVPYHLVYTIGFPVIVQLSRENEIFQFPVVVYIEKNARPSEAMETEDICDKATTNLTLYIEGSEDGYVTFKCLNYYCNIGKISSGQSFLVPACVNGKLIIKKEGFKEGSLIVNTAEGERVTSTIFLKKLHNVSLETKIKEDEEALLFIDNNSFFFESPVKNIQLEEGLHNLRLIVFKKTNLTIKEKIERCVKVPIGIFGIEKEQCFEEEIPIKTARVVIGGGKGSFLFSKENKIKIEFERFGLPKNIEELSSNYELAESSRLNIRLE